jgi:hypothetical protein
LKAGEVINEKDGILNKVKDFHPKERAKFVLEVFDTVARFMNNGWTFFR